MPIIAQADIFSFAESVELLIVFGHRGFNEMGIAWGRFCERFPKVDAVGEPFTSFTASPYEYAPGWFVVTVAEEHNHGMSDIKLRNILEHYFDWAKHKGLLSVATNGIMNIDHAGDTDANRASDDRRGRLIHVLVSTYEDRNKDLRITLASLSDVFVRNEEKAKRLKQFLDISFEEQGPIFDVPLAWADKVGVRIPPAWDPLPVTQLTRHEVRVLCQGAVDVMYGYVCAMAWGGQGRGNRVKNARTPLIQWDALSGLLNQVRDNDLTREDAFNLFLDNPIPGLGPSYFTKLMFFFSPVETRYILDQWTAKSINYIFGQVVALNHAKDGIAPSVRGHEYDQFCKYVEEILGLAVARGEEDMTGQKIEQRLFSRGGRKPGDWRRIVRDRGGPDPA